MQFYDVIQNRTSIKKFKDTQVDRQKVEKMISAAMMSPSWKNESSYRFILVDDKQKKEMLAESINNRNDEAANSVKEAPMVAVVVADPKESGVVDKKEYYLVDGAIAMEHFILAATAEGYGTCWIAALDENKVKNALEVPKEFRVIGLTPVGETDEKKEHYPSKSLTNHVFLNTWREAYMHDSAILH